MEGDHLENLDSKLLEKNEIGNSYRQTVIVWLSVLEEDEEEAESLYRVSEIIEEEKQKKAGDEVKS
jgi:hypothetical protein